MASCSANTRSAACNIRISSLSGKTILCGFWAACCFKDVIYRLISIPFRIMYVTFHYKDIRERKQVKRALSHEDQRLFPDQQLAVSSSYNGSHYRRSSQLQLTERFNLSALPGHLSPNRRGGPPSGTAPTKPRATSHEPLITLMAHAWLDFIFFAQHVVLVDILRVQ